jgi:phosphatidylethanolamine-binding protein (PEBP) family uncharacterized protein
MISYIHALISLSSTVYNLDAEVRNKKKNFGEPEALANIHTHRLRTARKAMTVKSVTALF